MTNLIFDLNNIAHRSLFITGGYGSKIYSFDSQTEIDQLVRKIAIDVSFIIRLINPSRVIFCLDDKSWRRSIKIDENEGYKANREKSSFINWNNVYSALNEFSDILEEKGMIVTKIKEAEADDIISLWANELRDIQFQHSIIVSGDEDLRQLVSMRYNDNKPVFVTVFNPFMQGKNGSRKLYVPKYFEDWINTKGAVDFLNMKASIDIDKEDFKKIITYEKTKMEEVDGTMIALRKLFCGDDGDNVPAFNTWLNEKGVEVRVTNSKFEKIYEMLKTDPSEKINHLDIIKRIDKLSEALEKVTKQSNTFNIVSRLNRQIRLVVLDPKFFPENIVEEFEKTKESELKKIRTNYASLGMKNILEGTRYVKEIKNESSIFKEIDRIKSSNLF